jgi:DNA-binding MarR family transcriptional regulator
VNSVFFGLKRAHLSTVKFCRGVLGEAKSELTPGRYDLLLYLRHQASKGFEVTQKEMREVFGVSRATMSEAVIGLLNRGLVSRKRADDGRTFVVTLTKLGKDMFDSARSLTKWLVNQALKKLYPRDDIMELHDAVGDYQHVRNVFGDTAALEIRPLWHPDD